MKDFHEPRERHGVFVPLEMFPESVPPPTPSPERPVSERTPCECGSCQAQRGYFLTTACCPNGLSHSANCICGTVLRAEPVPPRATTPEVAPSNAWHHPDALTDDSLDEIRRKNDAYTTPSRETVSALLDEVTRLRAALDPSPETSDAE